MKFQRISETVEWGHNDDIVRLTITIDDDVALSLKPLIDRMHGRSKKVINDLLRQALGITPKKA